MYDWRNMTEEEWAEVLEMRRERHLPWHSPPHWKQEGEHRYLISAACYEHVPLIGNNDRVRSRGVASLPGFLRGDICLVCFTEPLSPADSHGTDQ